MNQKLKLGGFEFYPNDRVLQLTKEPLCKLKQLRRDKQLPSENLDENVERGYKEMVENKVANPDRHDRTDEA